MLAVENKPSAFRRLSEVEAGGGQKSSLSEA